MRVAALAWLTLAVVALVTGADALTVEVCLGAAVVCALLALTPRTPPADRRAPVVDLTRRRKEKP